MLLYQSMLLLYQAKLAFLYDTTPIQNSVNTVPLSYLHLSNNLPKVLTGLPHYLTLPLYHRKLTFPYDSTRVQNSAETDPLFIISLYPYTKQS